ncbi:MAG: AAA family ATPase [Marinilabiliales bacterium]|nr:AAA family ATPase [Marinilabiliales bacterium]
MRQKRCFGSAVLVSVLISRVRLCRRFCRRWEVWRNPSALVLLATNRADILDPAVVRDGRVDVKVYVSRPTLESAGEIFNIHLKGVPLADGLKKEDIAASAAKRLFSDEYKYYAVFDRRDPKTPETFYA